MLNRYLSWIVCCVFTVAFRLNLPGRALAEMSAKWTKLLFMPDVQRSSHNLSVVGDKAYIYGGELLPREPVNANVQIVDTQPSECAQGGVV